MNLKVGNRNNAYPITFREKKYEDHKQQTKILGKGNITKKGKKSGEKSIIE